MNWFRSILFGTMIVFGLTSAGGILIFVTSDGFYEPPHPEAFIAEDFFEPLKRHDIGQSLKVAPKRTVMLFVGDIMLGRYVETLMRSNPQYPFEDIEPFLASKPFVFGNLEGPIVYDHYQTENFSTSFSFSEDKADVLVNNHFDAVALGNNHTLDRGADGYDSTKEILESRGILSTGHATQMGEEFVLTTDAGNEMVNFISFNVTFPANDEAAAVETVRSVSESNDYFTVVNVHWGAEYQLSSNTAQQEFAHQLIDAGADVIIGHHPHVTQEIEIYNNKLIFYSLGNFIFDQYFSADVQIGMAVSIVLQDDAVIAKIHPLQSSRSQVRLMDFDNRLVWLFDLALRSDEELSDQILQGIIRLDR